MQPAHLPVMPRESVEALAIRPDGTYVDATFGAGGHSSLILQSLGAAGRLVALDLDPGAAERAPDDSRFTLLHANFRDLAARLAPLGITAIDGILFDLGVSSMQLDEGERGFSFQVAAPLDMRLDPTQGESAAEWLATHDEREIADAIYEYGEERASRKIARSIVALRNAGTPVRDTVDLANVVARVVPRSGRIHPATRTFQALRIAVNDEFSALDSFLRNLPSCLNSGGRVAILTFHSGEDRRVKKSFEAGHRDGLYADIAQEVIRPSPTERHDNPRSSPAKLRWARKAE
jgi:16S rRNA (cytosine1402-N4)-methyltransferase